MCTKSNEEIEALLRLTPDRGTRRRILEELSACDSCQFGKDQKARLGAITCERHLVEFRNKVLYLSQITCSQDTPENSSPR